MKLTQLGQEKVIDICSSLNGTPCVFVRDGRQEERPRYFRVGHIARHCYNTAHKISVSLVRRASTGQEISSWMINIKTDDLSVDWCYFGRECHLTATDGKSFFYKYIISKLTLDDIEQ